MPKVKLVPAVIVYHINGGRYHYLTGKKQIENSINSIGLYNSSKELAKPFADMTEASRFIANMQVPNLKKLQTEDIMIPLEKAPKFSAKAKEAMV